MKLKDGEIVLEKVDPVEFDQLEFEFSTDGGDSDEKGTRAEGTSIKRSTPRTSRQQFDNSFYLRYNIYPMQKHKLLEKLEDKRNQLRISKEKFAVKKLDISYSTYHRWLHDRFNPDLKTIERIKQLLGENSKGGD